MPCHSVRHVEVTNMWCFNSFLLWISLPWCPIGFRSMLVFCTHRISTFQGSFFLFLVLLVEKCDFSAYEYDSMKKCVRWGFPDRLSFFLCNDRTLPKFSLLICLLWIILHLLCWIIWRLIFLSYLLVVMIIKHILISVSFPVLMQDWAMVPLQVSFRLMN